YKELASAGESSSAKQKAGEIAVLYKKLSTMNPASREEYALRAVKWAEIAAGKTGTSPQHPKNTAQEENSPAQTDALVTTSNVRWSDIGGLETVKQLIMETVVIAGLKRPESIKPWKGILLFGPPGTGKTLLAAAAAGSLDAAFYNVKASDLLSKYFGESAKLISELYESARCSAPSIVFIDEFDSLTRTRDTERSEASRTVLASLLTELDGLADKKSDQLLLTLAATNSPWDMDSAVLSRFPRRIYVTLPDRRACSEILQIQLKGMDVSALSFDSLAEMCVENRYAGRDLAALAQQAVWTMIHDANPNLHTLAELPFRELKERCLVTRPLQMEDFRPAFAKIRSPLTKDTIDQYEQWNKEYGSV
ncbi:MAG TPA: ATP-binding protein, partial [Methanocorpusculum sp.]|nr:ATP-binding protein [Methanocorpusculum sp.]